jgi:4-hydroxy-tetrahydrodipicolinate synthase
MQKLNESARGVFIISVTPFTERGDIDYQSADRLIEFYLACGVDGMTILGMMGEAQKLTAGESIAFARHVLKRVAGRVPVVVGVSSPGFAAMAELTAAVMESGAAGVMVAPPATLKADADIIRYYTTVAAAIGADVPFVLQDYPQSTGVVIAPSVILEIVKTLPSCVMLKHEEWPGLAKIAALRAAEARGDVRRISILVGNGGITLPEELRRGADGAMTGFSFPEMMVDVCRVHAAGDLDRAADLFDAYLPLARYELQPGLGVAIRKHILAGRGAIASPTLRKPAPSLSTEDQADIARLIERQARRLKELGGKAIAGGGAMTG